MEGEAEQAGTLQPGGEEVQGTFLMGQVKERSQGLLSGAQGENGRQRTQLKHEKFCVNIRKNSCKFDQAGCPEGCGVSILGGTENPAGHSPGQGKICLDL